MALAVPLLTLVPLGAACAAEPPASKGGDPVTTEMDRDPTETVQAHWDVSSPVTPKDLGSRFDDLVVAETLGNNGVDTEITLPGGDVVSGMFRTVTGRTSRDANIAVVDLASKREEDGGWDARIDEFIERFGGDRVAVDAYLDEIIPAIEAGGVDPEQSFRGDVRPGYEPVLQLRPDREGVVVSWSFFLEY